MATAHINLGPYNGEDQEILKLREEIVALQTEFSNLRLREEEISNRLLIIGPIELEKRNREIFGGKYEAVKEINRQINIPLGFGRGGERYLRRKERIRKIMEEHGLTKEDIKLSSF